MWVKISKKFPEMWLEIPKIASKVISAKKSIDVGSVYVIMAISRIAALGYVFSSYK